MQRLLCLLAVVGMMLTGCGDIEWFPEKAASVGGTATVTAFTIPPSFGALPSELKTSDPVALVISGGSAPISISGDVSSVYSINGNPSTNLPGTVVNGDQIVVQHTTANGLDTTTVTSILTVGDKSASFISSLGNFAQATVTASAAIDQQGTAQVALRLAPGNYVLSFDSIFGGYSFDGVNFTSDTVSRDMVDGELLFVQGLADAPAGTVTTYVFLLDGEPAVTLNVTSQ